MALNRTVRLRKNTDFQRVRQQGRRITTRLLGLSWAYNNDYSHGSRIGFVVSKRVSKHAVVRNYIKRLLGEAIRPLLADIPPGYDLVISAKNQIETLDTVTHSQLVAPPSVIILELSTLLRRSQLLISTQNAPETSS